MPATTRFRPLDGILLLDKPAGMSSNAALQVARRLFGAQKGGHTGSLDPLATGLLPLCFGEATKLAGLLLGSDKAYEAGIVLGTTTDTDDADGQVLVQRPVPAIDPATLAAALAGLTGVLQQRAPVYSALKQGGEPLYARARRGEGVHHVEHVAASDGRDRLRAEHRDQLAADHSRDGARPLEPGHGVEPQVVLRHAGEGLPGLFGQNLGRRAPWILVTVDQSDRLACGVTGFGQRHPDPLGVDRAAGLPEGLAYLLAVVAVHDEPAPAAGRRHAHAEPREHGVEHVDPAGGGGLQAVNGKVGQLRFHG